MKPRAPTAWYRQSLRIVRIRHALQEMLERGAAPDPVAAALEALRLACADAAAPEDLRREYDRWRVRFEASGLSPPPLDEALPEA